MRKTAILAVVGVVGIIAIFSLFKSKFFSSKSSSPKPTPTLGFAEQLPAEKHPRVSLTFSSDGHYVTVNISNIYSDQLEYNLIYDATVKKDRIQTGVNAASKLNGKRDYSYRQLLGSESSGKFTYHVNIQNAVMELTLRDAANRSVFTATYPFTLPPGFTVTLKPNE